jgi:4-aminobutyrate aminotransferase-like enzyme/Ser/Thr protein kinase RdoA (MazF antagonist)
MALLQQAPRLTVEAASDIACELYGIVGSASPLPSERDQNFLIERSARPTVPDRGPEKARATSAERFVLKIANATEDRAMLEAQNAAMAHLADRTALVARIVPTQSEEEIAALPSKWGGRHFVRLVTWLPGVTMGSVVRHSPALLEDLGRRIGEVDRALATFDHPAIHRDFYWDLANGLTVVREHVGLVHDKNLRALVERTAARIETNHAPSLARLRRSAIHNDANDHNVLVGGGDDPATRNQRIVGLVDFGDMVHSVTVGDLAIAIAYAVLNKPYPLAAAAAIVRGYHAANPLSADELDVLHGLVCLRLCVSVSVAADQQRQRPGDAYLAISQEPICRTLPRLAAIPHALAAATFRHACGLPPVHVPSTHVGSGFSRTAFAPLLGKDLASERLLVLDLSVGSPLVSGDPRENAEPALTPRIETLMREYGATVAIGRYGEARLLYTSPDFGDGDEERRTIHLGLDLFAPAGTPVHAPLDGFVHAFADKTPRLDYGPVVILKHVRGREGREGREETFYTLYGHLSRESLEGLHIGQRIARGDRFAAIGAAGVNGGWTPHLHFQVIVDLLDLDCDFPGVCRASERDVWFALSPDPSVIAGVPASAFPPATPDKSATLAARTRVMGPNLSIGYRDPVKAVRGWKQYLYDDTGRQYIDAYNNVPHVGHCHPRVVRAAADQMRVLNTNTRYLHDNLVRYAVRLTATLPDPLRVCYFVNSGSEANELALRLAGAHTGQRDLIVLDAAYHGNTTTLVAISPYKFNGPGGAGAPAWVHTVPMPDVYRGPYKKDDARAGEKYAAFVRATIDELRAQGSGVTGYIAESAPSVGGQIILPPGYLTAVYEIVREAGGVCIADEVQTAFGRLGTHFYAFEAQRVVPDIVVLGKPIGNGYPIGAVITTPAIAASFDNGMEFFSTFGGSTVSCAVGLAVLDVVEDERLQQHAQQVGGHLLDALGALASRHVLVGDVRGSGFFIGVELVRSRETLEPAAAEAAFVVNRMREEGILLGTDGPYANVLKIRPPMPFAEADAEALVRTLDRVLRELS